MRMPWEIADSAPAWKPGDRPIGAKYRSSVRKRDHLRAHRGEPCPYCHGIMHGRSAPTAPSRDHKIPLSRNGPNTKDNLIVCCRRCNEDKGSLTPEEYTAVRAGLASRLDKMIPTRRAWLKQQAAEPAPAPEPAYAPHFNQAGVAAALTHVRKDNHPLPVELALGKGE